MNDIQTISRDIVAVGKGLLAADESVHTANKRLTDNGIVPNEEMRRQYRELFLTAPDVEKYLSGVILFEETLGQSTGDGTPFSKLLSEKGIIPGIKVDKGTEPFDDSPDELITNGLIGLPERLIPFYEHGARFTKWRAVIRIDGDTLPTSHAILENAKRLTSYAHDAQVAGKNIFPELFCLKKLSVSQPVMVHHFQNYFPKRELFPALRLIKELSHLMTVLMN